MRGSVCGWLLGMAVAAGQLGCNNNPFAPAGASTAWQQPGQQQPYEAQLADLNRRASQLDANNRDLNAQLAQGVQQFQVAREQVALLQRQLQDSAAQLRESQTARRETERQLETLRASYERRGGAVLTANSSIRQTLAPVEIPGVNVRQDGEVIRVELASDQLFVGGGAQLQPTAYLTVDQVATAILRSYPRQRIGIEAHSDDSVGGAAGGQASAGPVSAAHQLTAAQAAAVLDLLATRNRLPPRQLFAVAHGANHPRVANTTADGRFRNRRVEVVIYPESIDAN
jgi:outer membrane protein OmpA-like peptidoglycan-associated protein